MSNVKVNGEQVYVDGEAVYVDGADSTALNGDSVSGPWRPAVSRSAAPASTSWESATPMGVENEQGWTDTGKLRSDSTVEPWRRAGKTFVDPYTLSWRKANKRFTDPLLSSWRKANKAFVDPFLSSWRHARTAYIDPVIFQWKKAPWLTNEYVNEWRQGFGGSGDQAISPWRKANHLNSEGGPWAPTVVIVDRWNKTANLHFCRPSKVVDPDHVDLYLGVDPCENVEGTAPVFILPQRTYMVVNSYSAITLADGLPITLFALDISADDGSFGWTMSANGDASLLERLSPVAGEPVQIQVTLNGLVWVFGVEGIRRSRGFNNSQVNITGRSMTMMAGDPYQQQTEFSAPSSLTAQQLVLNALQNTGVDYSWGIDDWTVQGGVWSMQGTPLSAVQSIIEAAGAILQSHRTDKQLLIKPRYPTLPWEWSTTTPDIEIALDAITDEGYERNDQPGYNGVRIVGNDLRSHVVRTGTDGTPEAPMVTDVLNVDPSSARQRGRTILGYTGYMANMSMSLPVLTGPNQPGVIDVGKLVQFNDPAGNWKGLVRAVTVRAARPTLLQTLTVERHL